MKVEVCTSVIVKVDAGAVETDVAMLVSVM